MSRKHVTKLYLSFDGKIHLCIDGWTSLNVISFLGITAHRVVDGKLERIILDFIKCLSKGHEGKYLAQQLAKCLQDYGIDGKILGITADNASSNTAMCEELEQLITGANSLQTKINCAAHVWNLVVKAIILPFAHTKKTETSITFFDDDDKALTSILDDGDLELNAHATDNTVEDSETEYELDPDREAFDLKMIEDITAEIEAEDSLMHQEKQVAECAVTKLIELAKCTFHSLTIHEDLATCCVKAKLTSADAITCALWLRPALKRLFAMPKHDKAGANELRRFKLSAEEWVILTQLHPILKAFLHSTERVSKANTPLLHEVIPLIDVLTGRLEKVIDDPSLHKAVRHAAARSLHILNKYYLKTDESIMYRCAMILHPSYKLNYFRSHQWPATWIDTSIEILREQWEAHYKPIDTPVPSPMRSSSMVQSSASLSTINLSDDNDLFAEIDSFGMDTTDDPISAYLKSSTEPVADPLRYWTSKLNHSPLACMVLDFLSAPASSVEVERAFSHGGLTV
ncbi:hypothetical protein NM688_g9172 [Phlebia brevispora]|uniref:Uncharacterized protein n=1 Tax=Phlebia brevispora TaxID=194682 RepID=A0ACC1RM65_9APHY|nr:hypothetical protein NM688_g9172 [Phlebia brevispora]